MQVFSPGRTLTVSGVRQAPARNIRHVMIVAQPLSDNPDKRRGYRLDSRGDFFYNDPDKPEGTERAEI